MILSQAGQFGGWSLYVKNGKAKGEIRHQCAHAIDMLPTVLDCLGLEPPAQIRGVTQSPIQGVSLKHTFEDGKAETKHRTQYFEMFAHRSIYHDGWRAVCPFPGPSFSEAGAFFGALALTEERLRELDAKGWELYDVAADPACGSSSCPCPRPCRHPPAARRSAPAR